MALANVARRQGDDFQARLFWLKAASLLDDNSPVTKVGYELGPKGFDDIWVEYDPDRARPDHEGLPIMRSHQQCKWHTLTGNFGMEDLTRPAFINATAQSFLQRALDAQRSDAPDGTGCRFELITNWRIASNDPLIHFIRKDHNRIDLDRLFDGSGDRSRAGKIRKCWSNHLGLDEDNLRLLVRTLAISEMTDSLHNLQERLDERFASVGLRRIPSSSSANPYDDLVFKLLAQGRNCFDRETFRAMCQKENLIDPSAPRKEVLTIGVRSFMHPIDNLEERCLNNVDLVEFFDGRYIRESTLWRAEVLPRLRQFLLEAARTADELRLILDAHTSIAFAAGAILGLKSGKEIDVEQRSPGRRFWSVDDSPPDASLPSLSAEQEEIAEHGEEVAVSISLTHDVAVGARAFIAAHLPEVGRVVHCNLSTGPAQQSVHSGRHANLLAEGVSRVLRRIVDSDGAYEHLHLFIAAPNTFNFFLGQHLQTLGPVTVYEWDFERRRGGGYTPGITLDR